MDSLDPQEFTEIWPEVLSKTYRNKTTSSNEIFQDELPKELYDLLVYITPETFNSFFKVEEKLLILNLMIDNMSILFKE